MFKIMMADELKILLEKDEVFLIDVREPDEHQIESINKAVLIPLSKISKNKIFNENRPIVVHCRSGVRSEQACRILLNEDSTLDVYNLKGGILAWREAGYPLIIAQSPK